jgi:hypothetical protein
MISAGEFQGRTIRDCADGVQSTASLSQGHGANDGSRWITTC